MEGGNDGPLGAFLGDDWGRLERGPFVDPVDDVGNHLVRVDPMNTTSASHDLGAPEGVTPLGITLTQAEFDALPIHRTPPGREVARRWKLESRGRWFVASYVEGSGFIEIMILEIEVTMTPPATEASE